jgi:hypothetical protein
MLEHLSYAAHFKRFYTDHSKPYSRKCKLTGILFMTNDF